MTTQGIETRQSGDAKQAPSRSDESPVGGNADAPNPNSNRPTQGSGGGADVTQADRDAAAAFYGSHLARPGEVPVAAHMLAGKIDESPLVQAFARHRLSSTPSNTQGALEAALRQCDDAIREMFRYYDGGETRGSYDGKPERAQLRKAGYAAAAAIAALKSGEAGLS